MTTNPRLAELAARLDATHAELHAAVAALPAEARDRRVAEDRWSAAEVVDHLLRVETGVVKLMHRLVAAAREQGVGPETGTAPVPGTASFAVLADRSRRIPAPEFVMARPDATMASALPAFDAARGALLEAVRAGDDLALGAVRWTHPVLGELDTYQWLLFVAEHEARHTAQIRDLANDLPQ